MHKPFATRRKAGEEFAIKLGKYAHRADVLVLALPRGGVPVPMKLRALDASQIGISRDRRFRSRRLGSSNESASAFRASP